MKKSKRTNTINRRLIESLDSMITAFENALEIDETGRDADGYKYACLTNAKATLKLAQEAQPK